MVMKRPNIKLHIDELVLHGFAPNDRYAIADAVERELAHLFTADHATPALSHLPADNSDVPILQAGSFQVAFGADGNSIGTQIARAIHGGITK
jgi:hypothetical protein